MNKIRTYLEKYYLDNNNIFLSQNFFDKNFINEINNNDFLNYLKKSNSKQVINFFAPKFEEMIFSTKREAPLELFDHHRDGICIDYSSMWGSLTLGMAKRGHEVISVDQSYDSLEFLKARFLEENLGKIHLVCDDIQNINLKNIADYVIVNGSLDLVDNIIQDKINNHLKINNSKSVNFKNNNIFKNSKKIQISFLRKVFENLNEKGQLLISFENKYSYKRFFEKSNQNSFSFKEINNMIKLSGFSQVESYCCFPNYYLPAIIFPNSKNGINEYEIYEIKENTWKEKFFFKYLEIFLMKYLKARNFCPSFIIVAKK